MAYYLKGRQEVHSDIASTEHMLDDIDEVIRPFRFLEPQAVDAIRRDIARRWRRTVGERRCGSRTGRRCEARAGRTVDLREERDEDPLFQRKTARIESDRRAPESAERIGRDRAGGNRSRH